MDLLVVLPRFRIWRCMVRFFSISAFWCSFFSFLSSFWRSLSAYFSGFRLRKAWPPEPIMPKRPIVPAIAVLKAFMGCPGRARLYAAMAPAPAYRRPSNLLSNMLLVGSWCFARLNAVMPVLSSFGPKINPEYTAGTRSIVWKNAADMAALAKSHTTSTFSPNFEAVLVSRATTPSMASSDMPMPANANPGSIRPWLAIDSPAAVRAAPPTDRKFAGVTMSWVFSAIFWKMFRFSGSSGDSSGVSDDSRDSSATVSSGASSSSGVSGGLYPSGGGHCDSGDFMIIFLIKLNDLPLKGESKMLYLSIIAHIVD